MTRKLCSKANYTINPLACALEFKFFKHCCEASVPMRPIPHWGGGGGCSLNDLLAKGTNSMNLLVTVCLPHGHTKNV